MIKIKISYVLLLLFTLFYTLFFEGGIQHFKEGWNSVDCSTCEESRKIITGTSPDPGRSFWILKGCSYLLLFTYIGIGIAFLSKLYHFIKSASRNKIFESINIKRVTSMGWLAILIGIITYLINYLLVYTKGTPVPQPAAVIYKTEFPFWPFLLGLVLLTVGYTFKKGVELKEENDLTV